MNGDHSYALFRVVTPALRTPCKTVWLDEPMLLVGTDAQLLYPANTFLSTKANRSTPPLLQGQLGAGGMSYRKYENPLEPPMDQIPPALRAGAVDLAVGFIPGLRFGARQQLLVESDYVALARLGHPGVETISNVQGDFSQRVNMRLREPKESAPPSSRGRCASMGLIYYRSTCAAFFSRLRRSWGSSVWSRRYRGLWVC